MSRILILFALITPLIAAEPTLEWKQLASIPDAEGFAGMFAGVSGEALLAAGGANIVGDKWSPTFAKRWYDEVFVLENPQGEWRSAGRLPRPLGYGLSVTIPAGILCAGGADVDQHFSDVFLLRWEDKNLQTTKLPSLPQPCAYLCGVKIGDAIYAAGGTESPDAKRALKTFWRLDLAQPDPRWEILPPWPGPERMLAIAGSAHGSFFLFGGVRLVQATDGAVQREYLSDAYRFDPNHGWTKIADLPRSAAGAPSPAPDHSELLFLLTGDSGSHLGFQPVEKHPGFTKEILAYDHRTDSWQFVGTTPFSRATAPTTAWQGGFVIPNGEVRPRVRTPTVWSLKIH